MPTTVSIVVPAYNEESTIARVIAALVENVPDLLEILVMDDGSTDRTRVVAEHAGSRYPQVRVLSAEHNRGKTAAVRAGFAASRGDVVLVQDADLEYDPSDIPNLIEPIAHGHADVVYGSRFLVKHAARVLYFRHYLANQVITFASNLLTDLNLTDVETGYKAFKGSLIRSMILESSGFGFEVEVTAKIAKLRSRVYEVPISYYGRTYDEGKKIGVRDGIDALWYVFKYNALRSQRASFKYAPKI